MTDTIHTPFGRMPAAPRSRASRRANLRCLALSASIAFALAACHKQTPQEAAASRLERHRGTEAREFYSCMNLAVGAFNAASPDTVHACEARAKQLADAQP